MLIAHQALLETEVNQTTFDSFYYLELTFVVTDTWPNITTIIEDFL